MTIHRTGLEPAVACSIAVRHRNGWRRRPHSTSTSCASAPDKWQGAGRDFLLGDADAYEGIPPADLAELRRVLDDAHAADLRVVLTTLSLPGARYAAPHFPGVSPLPSPETG